MECEIPCRIPRILPLVRHRNNVGVIQVHPVAVATVASRGRRFRLCGIAIQPGPRVVMKELLRPEQPCKCLALDIVSIRGLTFSQSLGVELVRLGDAVDEGDFKVGTECLRARWLVAQTKPDGSTFSGR